MNKLWKYTMFVILLQNGPDNLFSLLKGEKDAK